VLKIPTFTKRVIVIEVDKLSAKGNRPERKKVEIIAQKRDKKIKQLLTEKKYKKYSNLEHETRPKE